MRKELTAAQDKVKAMEHVVRSAERDVNVIRNEKKELSASLASNVGKLDKLLEHAKGMRQHRADVLVEMNAARKRGKIRLEVPCHRVAEKHICSYLIPTFLVCLQALQAEALRSQQEKQKSNRNKRFAQQDAKRLKARMVRLRQPTQKDKGRSMAKDEVWDPADGAVGDGVEKQRWQRTAPKPSSRSPRQRLVENSMEDFK